MSKDKQRNRNKSIMLTDTQRRLLRRFKNGRSKANFYHDVCIHDSSNRGGRFSFKTFLALYNKGLIVPSPNHVTPDDATWFKLTDKGIAQLKEKAR